MASGAWALISAGRLTRTCAGQRLHRAFPSQRSTCISARVSAVRWLGGWSIAFGALFLCSRNVPGGPTVQALPMFIGGWFWVAAAARLQADVARSRGAR